MRAMSLSCINVTREEKGLIHGEVENPEERESPCSKANKREKVVLVH